MKTKIFISSLFLLLIVYSSSCSINKNNYNNKDDIKPYLQFLKSQNKSAKEYVLDLFKQNDLVIICERFHPEITQYDLYLDILQDSNFVANVGNVFIEVCGRDQKEKINYLIHSEDISEKIIDSLTVVISRDASSEPIWTYYNFPYFLKGIQKINKNLPKEQKIELYPSDLAVNWDKMTNENYQILWDSYDYRDSIMAEYIIEKFDSIKKSNSTRKKALILMNYRHSFGNKFMYPDNVKPENVGRYLFEKYDGKIANVLINSLSISNVKSDNDFKLFPINDGKWDASFKILNKDNVGFNLKNSPFGNDYFDYWLFTKHNYNYSDVFNGFIYYTPIEKIVLIDGIPNIIDSNFISEFKRRAKIVNQVLDENISTEDSIIWENNIKKADEQFINDSIKKIINKWIN